MSNLSPANTFDNLKTNVVKALQEQFPYSGRKNTLQVDNIRVEDDLDSGDIKDQLKTKHVDGTWTVPVKAEVKLVDNATGKVIDHKKSVTITRLPKLTNRNSFIIGGNEIQPINLLRLKSGVYTRVKQNGELESEFNLEKSLTHKGFSLEFDPKKRKFLFAIDSTHVPLYSVLKSVGVADDDIEKDWGKAIFESNKRDSKQMAADLKKFYEKTQDKFSLNKITDHGLHINNFFEKAELRPDTTKITLGKEFTTVTPEALRLSAAKILGVSRGTHKPDDRDSLAFKKISNIEDFIPEMIRKSSKSIKARMRNVIDHKETIPEILTHNVFSKPIHTFFTNGNGLSERPDQVNPLEILSAHRKTTIMSKELGGIKGEHSLVMDMKVVNPSHFGFLDPSHTPEGEKTGISLHLSQGALKKGNSIETIVYNRKTGKYQNINVTDFHGESAVLPDQITWKNGKPVPANSIVKVKLPGGDIVEKPFTEANLVMISSKALFDHSTNSIPFLPCTQGNRVSMASKQIEQAISLKHREAPYVQCKTDHQDPTHTFEKLVGSFTTTSSPVEGKVKSIKKDSIVINDGKKDHEVFIYDHFPLNGTKEMLHSEPIIKVGDSVKKGQKITDTNFTKNGVLALGANLRVAYLPYKGYNFEDGIVISESAAKKLTSEHLHRRSIEVNPDTDHISKKKYMAFSSVRAAKMTNAEWDTLDDDGIIKPGTQVKPGQLLVTALAANRDNKQSSILAALGKRGIKPFKDASLTWDEDHIGTVIRVVKNPNGKEVKVFVKTEEPMVIGDKASGRYGNKGIVSTIIPDHKMPFTKDSKTGERRHLEVLLSPSGVPSRMNPSQMLETASAKIAEKTGKPYIVDNFSGPNHNYLDQVTNDLKKHGISDEEQVYDPENPNKAIGSVLVGPQYLLKLKHQVDKKLSARGGGTNIEGKPLSYDLDKQPSKGEGGGQGFGQLEMYALLGHNARSVIREMATYKSDFQDATFWNMIQQGKEPPPPKIPFVYEKFVSYLKGLGVDYRKEGTGVRLVPMTEKEIHTQADNGKNEIKNGALMLRQKDLREEQGGLFDPIATGGKEGSKWSYLRLHEAVPNPIFMGHNVIPGPIPTLLGIGLKDLNEIILGKQTLNGKTGGAAIEAALKKVDVKAELKKTIASLKDKTKGDLDRANRKTKYLQALDELNLNPHEVYMLNSIPVIPPKFRPITTTHTGDLSSSPINGLYKNIALINHQIKDFHPLQPESDKAALRAQLWDSVKALQSVGNYKPVFETMGDKRALTGIIDLIGHGSSPDGSPKEGLFQAKLIKRRQGLSIRSTIIPEPSLGLDEIGMPKHALLETYKPFVVAKLSGWGFSPLDAQNEIKKKSDAAIKALEKVVEERPIIVKRDPALHKFSVMAFKPRLIDGKSIQIHPLVCGGFNADFDGDQQIGTVIIFVENTTLTRLVNYEIAAKPWNSKSWWAGRIMSSKMTSRYKETIGYTDNGNFYVCNLEDFPHYEMAYEANKIEFYPVPPGIKVISFDDKNNMFVMAKAAYWSKHKERTIEIITLASGRQIITDDDPRAIYCLDEEFNMVRKRPKEAIGLFVPTAHITDLEDGSLFEVPTGFKDCPVKHNLTLNFNTGRVLGLLSGKALYEDDRVRFRSKEAATCEWLVNELSCLAHHWDSSNITGNTKKSVYFGGPELAALVSELTGEETRSKHLPPFFIQAPKEFQLGLLNGILESCSTISERLLRGAKIWEINATSASLRLLQDVSLLCRSLGIRATVTKNKEVGDSALWIISFSKIDLHKLGKVSMQDVEKLTRYQKFFSSDPPNQEDSFSRSYIDSIPAPRNFMAKLRHSIGDSLGIDIYNHMDKSVKSGLMSRAVAKRIVTSDKINIYDSQIRKWMDIVNDDRMYWDRVDNREITDLKETGYDLTVPEYETFMSLDGIILSNTMAGTVPVSKEAVEEAKKMFPSNNLFSPTTGDVMYAPSQDAIMGLNLISKWGKETSKTIRNVKELQDLVQSGKMHITDVVKVKGMFGNKPTTLGRILIESRLPRSFNKNSEILHSPDFIINKKVIGPEISMNLAKNHESDFSKSIDGLKDLGYKYSYELGFSIGLKDLKTYHGRDKILSDAAKEVHSATKNLKSQKDIDAKTISIYSDATDKMLNAIKKDPALKDNRLAAMVLSGARGNPSQLMQIIAAPMLMQDSSNRTVPTPVTKSYSEGLDLGNYWIAQHGARKGTLQRAQGTSEPGALSKVILNSTISTLITSKDCGTSNGILMGLAPDDKDQTYKDVHDRYLAKDYKLKDGKTIKAGTIITPEISAKLRNSKIDKIVARSPLKCELGDGLCAKCSGLGEHGKEYALGTNIGILAGQSIAEPTIQLAMDAFHSGGVAVGRGFESVDRLTRLKNMLEMPVTLKNEATISMASGKITKIEKDPAGGLDIHVGGVKSYVPIKLIDESIKVGQEVKKGDKLSLGYINPHTLLSATKDIHSVQNYLTNELNDSLFSKEGVRRRNIEIAVKTLTNLAHVTDSGHSEHMRGDVIPRSMAEDFNRNLPKGHEPIQFAPLLKGMKEVPSLITKNWIARLNFQNLAKTLQEAASRSLVADLHSTHPIPGMAQGSEFGKPPPGKPPYNY